MSKVDDFAASQSAIFHVDPKSIKIRKGWNCRDFSDPANLEHVKALAISIRAVGVKEPLTVVEEGGDLILVNGESRLRAIELLAKDGIKIETVPVQVDPDDTDEQTKLAEQIARNTGRPYTVLEQCDVFTRLRSLGMDDKEIAANAGMTLERMRQIVSLSRAPKSVWKLIRADKVSATLVQRIISGAEDDSEIEAQVKEAVSRAAAEGKEKAGPRHVVKRKAPEPKDVPGSDRPMLRVSAKSLMTELLGYQVKEPVSRGKSVTLTLKVPIERWEIIRESTN